MFRRPIDSMILCFSVVELLTNLKQWVGSESTLGHLRHTFGAGLIASESEGRIVINGTKSSCDAIAQEIKRLVAGINTTKVDMSHFRTTNLSEADISHLHTIASSARCRVGIEIARNEVDL